MIGAGVSRRRKQTTLSGRLQLLPGGSVSGWRLSLVYPPLRLTMLSLPLIVSGAGPLLNGQGLGGRVARVWEK